MLLGSSPVFLVLLALIGWFGPDVYLSRAGRLRQEAIERSLPDFLDILAVSVRAGLGYRYALRRVAEALAGPASEEMLTVLRQMDLGQDRREAFLALRERNRSESLKSFVAAQLQAEELGVPLAEALNDIASDMRRLAYQNARRQAQRAGPRVSLLVTTLIVPGSMILILISMFFATGREAPRLADRLEGRGADGAGGWLASACRLILNVRAGILLVTLLSLSQEEHRTLMAAAICVAGIASLIPILRWDQVGPAIVRHPSYLAGELVLAALILFLTGVDSPFFFFTLGTALLGGLVYGYPGAALFSVMLVVVYAYAIHLRAPFDATLVDFRTVVVLPALYPIVARRRRGRAAAAGPPGRGRVRARRAGADAGRAGRARAARARHARLAGQDRARHRLLRARALAPHRASTPQGAVDDALKLAADARTAAQEARELLSGLRGPRRRRAAAADRDPLRGGALGRADRDRASAARSTTSGRCRRWRCASCAGSSRRRSPTSSATRTPTRVDVHLRRLGDRVVLTIADDGDGFEAPDDLERAGRRRLLRAARHARAGASSRAAT